MCIALRQSRHFDVISGAHFPASFGKVPLRSSSSTIPILMDTLPFELILQVLQTLPLPDLWPVRLLSRRFLAAVHEAFIRLLQRANAAIEIRTRHFGEDFGNSIAFDSIWRSTAVDGAAVSPLVVNFEARSTANLAVLICLRMGLRSDLVTFLMAAGEHEHGEYVPCVEGPLALWCAGLGRHVLRDGDLEIGYCVESYRVDPVGGEVFIEARLEPRVRCTASFVFRALGFDFDPIDLPVEPDGAFGRDKGTWTLETFMEEVAGGARMEAEGAGRRECWNACR